MKENLKLEDLLELINILTPTEKKFLLKQSCLLPPSSQNALQKLLSQEASKLKKLSSSTINYLARWILEQLAINLIITSPKSLLISKYDLLLMLKYRQPNIFEILKPILDTQLWEDDKYWENYYEPWLLTKWGVDAQLGTYDLKTSLERYNDLLNKLLFYDIVSIVERNVVNDLISINYHDINLLRKSLADLDMLYSEMIKRLKKVDPQINNKIPYSLLLFILMYQIISKRFYQVTQLIKQINPLSNKFVSSNQSIGNNLLITTMLSQLLNYSPFLNNQLDYTHMTRFINDTINSLIFPLLTKERKFTSSIGQTAILLALFPAVKTLSFHSQITLSTTQYQILARLSKTNPLFQLSFLVYDINATFNQVASRPNKLTRTMSKLKNFFRTHLRDLTIIYYLWEFIIRFETQNYESLIDISNASYQWASRHKSQFKPITLWMKRFSTKLHQFTAEETWQQATNELLNIYLEHPLSIIVEEFCPLTNWLLKKSTHKPNKLDDFPKLLEERSRGLIPCKLLDELDFDQLIKVN